MRKASLTAFLVVVAFLCAGIASAAGPSATVRSGNLEMTFGESFVPQALSSTVPTPIELRLWSRIESIDGSRPTTVSEFVFDNEESIAIDATGLPICSGGRRGSREPNPIKGCEDAIVGTGAASIDLRFPDLPPIPLRAKSYVYNGGTEAGVTTLYSATYFLIPAPTMLVMTIRTERIQEGRFASRTTITVPKIAGGSGSLTSFNVKIGRDLVRKGKRVSLLTAKCPSGRIHARAQANFVDGTSIRSRLARNCGPSD